MKEIELSVICLFPGGFYKTDSAGEYQKIREAVPGFKNGQTLNLYD